MREREREERSMYQECQVVRYIYICMVKYKSFLSFDNQQKFSSLMVMYLYHTRQIIDNFKQNLNYKTYHPLMMAVN